MARKPNVLYPSQTAVDPNYPDGKAQNDISEDDGTGTPLEQAWLNELFGFQQALLADAGTPANGVAESVAASQYLEAIKIVSSKYVAEHAAVQTWSKTELPINASGMACVFDYLVPVRLPGLKQKAIVALGYDNNDFQRLRTMLSFGSAFFDSSPVSASPTDGPCFAGPGADGEFYSLAPGVVALAKFSGLATKTIESLSPNIPTAFYYAAFCAKYIVITTNGNIFHGAATTSLASATDPSITAFTASTLGFPNGEFADDASANIVCVIRCTIGGVDVRRILHSADNGATWTVAFTFGAGISCNVVWSAKAQKFWALDSAGNILTSTTGLTWVSGGTTTITASNGAVARPNSLACVGRCIAKLYTPTFYSFYSAAGIAYSFDLGATWRFHTIGDVTSFNLQTLIAANNRFYATDSRRVYRSGLLDFSAADA